MQIKKFTDELLFRENRGKICKQEFDINMYQTNEDLFSYTNKDCWGKFWKYLSPKDQKNILFNLSEINETGKPCQWDESQLKYAISSTWWRAWCDFVNLEFWKPSDQFNPLTINRIRYRAYFDFADIIKKFSCFYLIHLLFKNIL